MPDTDPLAAELAIIRNLNEHRIEVMGYTEATVRRDAAEGDVRRLLKAVGEVLGLVAATKCMIWRDGKPCLWDLDPEAIRSAILAGLTGEGKAGT